MINEAIKYFDFDQCTYELIRHNENRTYKIIKDEKNYLLRIHKPTDGFNIALLNNEIIQKQQIESEVRILEYLSEKSNLRTQKIIKNIYGDSVTVLKNGLLVTVLEWIDGCTLEDIKINDKIAFKIGVMIGKMHNTLKEIDVKYRYEYNDITLFKMIDECKKAHKLSHLNENQTATIIQAINYIIEYIKRSEKNLILVHSDLSKSNMIYKNDEIIPIDFSLAGYCLPEMDLASVFSNINDDKLNNEILKGYMSICNLKVDRKGIDIFLCFQILLFITFQHNKFGNEPWFFEKVDEWCVKNFMKLC